MYRIFFLYKKLCYQNILSPSQLHYHFQGTTIQQMVIPPIISLYSKSVAIFSKTIFFLLKYLNRTDFSEIHNSKSTGVFKRQLLTFIRGSSSSVFDIWSSQSIKLSTIWRLDPSHLSEYQFRHGFMDAINTIGSWKMILYYFSTAPNKIHCINGKI